MGPHYPRCFHVITVGDFRASPTVFPSVHIPWDRVGPHYPQYLHEIAVGDLRASPKVFPWVHLPRDCHGTPVQIPSLVPWDFHGTTLPTVLPWDRHGTPMGLPWGFHGSAAHHGTRTVLPTKVKNVH